MEVCCPTYPFLALKRRWRHHDVVQSERRHHLDEKGSRGCDVDWILRGLWIHHCSPNSRKLQVSWHPFSLYNNVAHQKTHNGLWLLDVQLSLFNLEMPTFLKCPITAADSIPWARVHDNGDTAVVQFSWMRLEKCVCGTQEATEHGS